MPRIAKNKDESAIQNEAETKEPKKKVTKKSKELATETVAEETAAPIVKKGHVFYSLFSRSRGWITESTNPDRACEALDEYYFDWLHKVNNSEKKIIFDFYILKRDTSICHTNSSHYVYFPGSYTERKREEHLRAKYGDRYRENDSEDDYDYSQYADDFKAGGKKSR